MSYLTEEIFRQHIFFKTYIIQTFKKLVCPLAENNQINHIIFDKIFQKYWFSNKLL